MYYFVETNIIVETNINVNMESNCQGNISFLNVAGTCKDELLHDKTKKYSTPCVKSSLHVPDMPKRMQMKRAFSSNT